MRHPKGGAFYVVAKDRSLERASEVRDHFYVVCLREHVYRRGADEFIPCLLQAFDIARPGRGVAAHVRHARGASFRNAADNLGCEARAGRVNQQRIELAQLRQLACRIAADDLDVVQVRRLARAAQVAHT